MSSILKKLSDILSIDLDHELNKAEDLHGFLLQLLLEAKEAVKLATVEVVDAIHMERKIKCMIDYLCSLAIKSSDNHLQLFVTHYQNLEMDATEIVILLKSRLDAVKQKLKEIYDKMSIVFYRRVFPPQPQQGYEAIFLNQYDLRGSFFNFRRFEEKNRQLEVEHELTENGLVSDDYLEEDDLFFVFLELDTDLKNILDRALTKLKAKMSLGDI
ncbi:MAG TPA: hypothetical protein DCS93_01875 [Microscillaceae bacterium]|nr:hypothetical protein [Microscillaceae bacterium]